MADKTFEGYKITGADISTRVEDRKYRGRYFYEIHLTLESIGDNMGDSEARKIWEKVFNILAEKDISDRRENLRGSQIEPQDFKYQLPWKRIECGFDNLLPVLYVYDTEPRKIEENRGVLKKLVENTNDLAQKEIDKVNQEKEQLGDQRKKLKQLKWDE